MKLSSRIFVPLIAGLSLLLVATLMPASAQNQFTPVAYVNDKVITRYELEQRIKFLEILGTPGDLKAEALDRLIEERLQREAAEGFNLTLETEQIFAGVEEFAARANLTGPQLIDELAKIDIAQQTLRDFVAAGLLWRELVQGLFGPRSQVTEDEIDRAIAQSSGSGGIQVLMTEIVLPTTPEFAERTNALVPDIQKLRSTTAFSSAASQYSAAPSKARGGRLDWLPISSLPNQIRSQILGLKPGEVTAPITVPNAVALFQLRDKREAAGQESNSFTAEYAQFYISGGRNSETLGKARRIREDVDTCDDLYGVNKGNPDEQLVFETLPENDIPADVRKELASMDPNEVSTALTRNNGQTLVFLMLCGRTPELNEDIARQQIRTQLVNARLVSFASGYISELRADAVIRIP
ncbi:MAG: peptidylprolyl isomerase [Pseudoruegeria sp.]